MLSTTVYRGRLFSLGEFHCPPGSERWRQINVVEEPALVAFPGTSVVIEHLGRPPLLANQNHVMFYNHEQRYRRALHDGRGDHCVFVAVELSLLAELLAAAGLELEEPALPFTNGRATLEVISCCTSPFESCAGTTRALSEWTS